MDQCVTHRVISNRYSEVDECLLHVELSCNDFTRKSGHQGTLASCFVQSVLRISDILTCGPSLGPRIRPHVVPNLYLLVGTCEAVTSTQMLIPWAARLGLLLCLVRIVLIVLPVPAWVTQTLEIVNFYVANEHNELICELQSCLPEEGGLVQHLVMVSWKSYVIVIVLTES
jgi:hypothetical protein